MNKRFILSGILILFVSLTLNFIPSAQASQAAEPINCLHEAQLLYDRVYMEMMIQGKGHQWSDGEASDQAAFFYAICTGQYPKMIEGN